MAVRAFEPLEALLPSAALSGTLLRSPRPDAGLLVAIPGGGYTGEYFRVADADGASLLTAAAASGWNAISIDRPGYEGSSAVPECDFTEQARVIAEAIDTMVSRLGSPIVLGRVSHRFGVGCATVDG